MNVCHIYARNYNFGDHVLGTGVKNLFSRYFSKRLSFTNKDVHTLVFDDAIIETLNHSHELLLIGGGGLIHGFAGDTWMLKIPDNLIPKMSIPMIIYGVGYNQFRGEGKLHENIIRNIQILQKHCASFSVRNDKSKEELKKYNIEVPEVPDPGFFVDGDYSKPYVKGKYCIIQLANDMKSARGFDDNTLITHLIKVSEYFFSLAYHIILCPHVHADIELGQKLIERLAYNPRIFSWDWAEMMKDENLNYGLSYYKHADLVIAMRGHSQICPIGMGTPVITIGNHRKHYDLLDALGLTQYYVEVNDSDLSDKLIPMIDDVLQHHEEIKMDYQKLVHTMEKQSRNFIRNIQLKHYD